MPYLLQDLKFLNNPTIHQAPEEVRLTNDMFYISAIAIAPGQEPGHLYLHQDDTWDHTATSRRGEQTGYFPRAVASDRLDQLRNSLEKHPLYSEKETGVEYFVRQLRIFKQ